jgi:hypothetical protein
MKELEYIRSVLADPAIQRLMRESKIKSVTDVPMDQSFNMIGGPWPAPIDDSKPYLCYVCGDTVSISPSGQKLMQSRAGKYTIVCVGCAQKMD